MSMMWWCFPDIATTREGQIGADIGARTGTTGDQVDEKDQ